MSSVVQVIEPALPAESPQMEVPRGARGFRGLFGKNIWALCDQALISITNFATAALTLRALAMDGENGKREFGTFSAIYAALLFANIFQSTLITQPHNVLGVTREGEAYRRYTTATALMQLGMLLLQIVLGLVLVVIAWGRSDAATFAMFIALIPSIVFWQLQEFVRRVMYTEHRFAGAFFNDIISYGGQTAVIVALFVARLKWNHPMTGAMALYALAWTSAAAVLVGAWQIRRSFCAHIDTRAMLENWQFGKWLTGGELMGYCSSVYMQVLLAARIIGPAASADLRAAQILLGPTRVISLFLQTVLPIRFARALHSNGVNAMHQHVRRVYRVLAPLAGVYCLILLAFPGPLLHLMYGRSYAVSMAVPVLMLCAVAAFISYMQMVIVAALTAARQTRYIFIGSAVGCVIALATSPVLIMKLNAPGGVVAMICTAVVVTLLYVRAYLKQFKDKAIAASTKESQEHR